MNTFSPYINFSRAEWADLRYDTPLTLTEEDLVALRGVNDEVALEEVIEVYLPLSRLLNLYVEATQELYNATATFLGGDTPKVPYMIGLAGSVAVGKSTTARILRALLSRWPGHPHVDLITTDGFLYPNAYLKAHDLMHRKGFPESYDVRRLIEFVGAVKSGYAPVRAPVYSHLTYDILPEAYIEVKKPDIVILEGINVLQTPPPGPEKGAGPYVSDFFDFSIYVNADPDLIETWFLERFHTLRKTAFVDPASYFKRYASMSFEEADQYARTVWKNINALNLHENIAPTRDRANLVLTKGASHAVEQIQLRKI